MECVQAFRWTVQEPQRARIGRIFAGESIDGVCAWAKLERTKSVSFQRFASLYGLSTQHLPSILNAITECERRVWQQLKQPLCGCNAVLQICLIWGNFLITIYWECSNERFKQLKREINKFSTRIGAKEFFSDSFCSMAKHSIRIPSKHDSRQQFRGKISKLGYRFNDAAIRERQKNVINLNVNYILFVSTFSRCDALRLWHFSARKNITNCIFVGLAHILHPRTHLDFVGTHPITTCNEI